MSQHTPPQGGPKPARSAASTAILVTTSVVGGLALLGAAGSAAFAFGMRGAAPWDPVDVIEDSSYISQHTNDFDDAVLYADAEGVTSIDIEAAATDFTVQFGNVTEAELMVADAENCSDFGVNGWTLERVEDELVIERDLSEADEQNCIVTRGIGGFTNGNVTLTLPRELGNDRSVSLDASISAGELTATGSFDELSLEINVGDMTFTGDARSLDVDVTLGDSTIEVSDVEEAEVSVTTGDSTIVLTGDAPQNVELAAKMGAITVTLPQATYRVDSSGVIGEVDNRLDTSKDSKNVIKVNAKAAEIVLK